MTDPPTARVLVVEPTPSGAEVLRAARQLGIETVVASYDAGDRRLAAEVRTHADLVVTLDTNDEAALGEAVCGLHARAPLAGILPGFEFYVDSVARLADRLGLPGLPVEAADTLRDKASMRRATAAAGLRVPRFAEVSGAADLADAAAAVGFPLVLKPTSSAGSVHVSRADDLPGLRAAYEWLVTDTRTDLGRGLDGRALVEEYVAGPEISVEGYVLGAEVVVVAVTGKLLGPEPHFVEVGHVVQAELPEPVRARVDSYVRDVCRALHLTRGPFHCELRLPAGEPVLIEIGARLAGDHIADLVSIATGVCLPRVMLATYTDRAIDTIAPPTAPTAKCAAIHFLTAPPGRVFAGVPGLDALRRAPDVVGVEVYLQPGEPTPPQEDFRARIGHVIYTADSYDGALARRREIEREVRLG